MRILKSKFSQQPRRNKGETEDLLIRGIALRWHLKNQNHKMKIKLSKTAKKSGNAPAVEWKKNDEGDWEGYINGTRHLSVAKDGVGGRVSIDVSPQGCSRSRHAYSSAKTAKRGAERMVKWLREMYG